MITNSKTMGNACPVAYIAANKQRIKQYVNNVVYLKNKNNFEIELFNPTQFKVLATIELNGVSIGSGIILRPAERVFLERYINEPKKFLFETYGVEGENNEVIKAIEKNGLVRVKFYKESIFAPNISWGSFEIPERIIYGGPHIEDNITWLDGSKLTNFNPLFGSAITTSASCYYNSTGYNVEMGCQEPNGTLTVSGNLIFNSSTGGQSTNSLHSKKSIETGRVGEGSDSDQRFNTVDTKFEMFHTWSSEWKLLPESRKLVVAEDLVLFCSGCGRRFKTKERFCPSCGSKK